MTTGKRITISLESARLALADQQAQFAAMPEAQRLERMKECAAATPGEYAAAAAGHLFSLLEKHAEESR